MEQNRKRFEEWIISLNDGDDLARSGDGYEDSTLDAEWRGFQAGAQSQWRPIEEAPKDGTRVLLLCRHYNCKGNIVELMWWDKDWGEGKWVNDYDSLQHKSPTKWMPIPQEDV